MKISVFGLGYVGVVSAGILASEGHQVVGVDPNGTKLELINGGKSPIVEPQIGDLIAESVAAGRLRATENAFDAVSESDLSFVCVGTPSCHNGNLDLSYVRRVCEEIGAALARKESFHVVVIRSTMLPGTMQEVVIPTLTAAAGKELGSGFGVCMNPEFLREGSAVDDYRNPPKIVVGESDRKSGDWVIELYAHLDAPRFRTDIPTAEMVKYADNAWHAVKVTFANEIGSFCKSTGIDSHQVMDIFCNDMKLNLSPYYMRPGFSFGGSCLPKDLRALTYRAKRNDLDLPLLNSVMPSNEAHFSRGVDMVVRSEKSRVGILGLSFKAGTDDLRESPILTLVEYLIDKGYDLRIYDKNVNLAKLMGANRDYILNRIPHISKLMVDSLQEVLDHAEVVVVGNNAEEFRELPSRTSDDCLVVDLVRIAGQRTKEGHYEGICW